jgi:hypothetical protein
VKTSPKRSYSVIQNERFGRVFTKTGSIISGTGSSGSWSHRKDNHSSKHDRRELLCPSYSKASHSNPLEIREEIDVVDMP